MPETNEPEFYSYDENKRALAKQYETPKLILGLIEGAVVPLTYCLILISSGLSRALSQTLNSALGSYWISTAIYLLIFTLLMLLVEFPFALYSGFILDHKFELSTQSLRGWLVDESKEVLIEAAFGVLLGTALYYLIRATSLWWLVAAVLFALFEIVLSAIIPFVLMPIFYKVTPLSDESLRQTLLAMSEKAGAKNIERVLIADESRRSVRANAMFSGVGKARAIVLFDTLIRNFTKREAVTVVAHELGHYVNKDIWKSALFSGLMMIPSFLIADYALQWSVGVGGLTSVSDPAGFPVILGALIAVGLFLQPISNGISRIQERQADEFALRSAHDPDAQASSERRLADLSLSVDNPGRLVELFFYTHPAPSRRVKLAQDWKESQIEPENHHK